MKRLFALIFSVPLFLSAQNKPLVIEGVTPHLYINHTVGPKENYYSIGRIYNISPKEIAPFNNLALEKGLSLGQIIKIPLTQANFIQAGNAAPDEVLVPIYHSVTGKESLSRISVNYNKLPLEKLKQWNNLKNDAAGSGTHLIIGYLKIKKGLSPLANMAKAKPTDNPVKTVVNTDKPVPVKEAVNPVVSKAELPAEKIPSKASSPPPVTKKIKKEPVSDTVAREAEPAKKIVISAARKNFEGGVFRTDFEKQTQDKTTTTEMGAAAVFKSTSGWDDGKYYCLHNTSSPGTVLKITNNATGKSVYAKVLDTIPDITQNSGLLIRVCNAAAEELGAGDTKFDCTLNYSK